MISSSTSQKHYASARKRFLEAAISQFFADEFPRFFGPTIREKLAVTLTSLVEAQTPAKDSLRSGQCLWNAVSIHTRPDSKNLRLVPVILTLVDKSDVDAYAKGERQSAIMKRSIARILKEAYRQEALLSMRDLSLLFGCSRCRISALRLQFEQEQNEILPHVGSLQDFGSTISHKEAIIRKIVFEGKDPLQAARETRHSQRAVDRYLKDYHRVKSCFDVTPDIDFIRCATGLSKCLINKYLALMKKYEKTT
jgi:hypothetical protein